MLQRASVPISWTSLTNFPALVLVVLLEATLVLSVGAGIPDHPHNNHNHNQHNGGRFKYGQHDAVLVTRCEAQCWTYRNKSACIKSCLLKTFDKPGKCPRSDTISSPFAAVCLDTCYQDSQCPALLKCCRHSCGVTCQHPEDVLSATGIPEIPRDVRVTEGRKKQTVYIEWKPGGKINSDAVVVLFLIEERHHAGKNFIDKRLSEWTPCGRSPKTSHILRNFVKPGRWYQFRVAAINENGTKGFSESSLVFSVSVSPKPPRAPQNVTVGPLWTSNGSLTTELRWTPPHSDLPIQRYKVFWSRRLHGATDLDSVLVHQQIVSKDETKFLLQNLQPNSLYFLQVQAVAQFGKDRLKGEKSGLVLNTTNYTNVTDNAIALKVNPRSRIEDLHLQKLFWSQGDLRARIIWKPKKGPLRYTVSWWTGPCHQNFKSHSHFKLAATTKASHFDLYDLQFNCRYRVSVREVSPEGMKSMLDTSVTFITPSCNDFKQNYKKVRCAY